MTTNTIPPTPLSRRVPGWRVALVASGLTMLAGGPLHPDAEAGDSLRVELATMTADPNWVPGHALLVAGTLLLVGGLVAARRQRAWPRAAARSLAVAIAALSLYAVETVVHLAAAVDSSALEHGQAAPVAFTHIGLAAVLYPVSGLAVAHLATVLVREQRGTHRAVALLGVVGGLAHAASVPLTLLEPDGEFRPVFVAGGVLLALWAAGTGLAGVRGRTPVGEVPASGGPAGHSLQPVG